MARQALTQKQEAFCLAYIETGNASEAYRQVYSTEKMKPETINNKAYELLKKGEITARLTELRKRAADEVNVTLTGHLESLKLIRDKAINSGQLSAAATAEIARGKAAGLYVDRKQIEASVTAAEPVRVVFEYPDNGRMAGEGTE